MKSLLILLFAAKAFAQDVDLEKFRKQISEPSPCRPRIVKAKPGEPQLETYQLNCCPPIALKGGGLARIEDMGGIYKIATYKNKADVRASVISPDAKLLAALGPPNQKCLQMKYYAKFDILTIYQFKGLTNGYSEVALDVVKIENGKPLRPVQFVLMDRDEDESTKILTPEVTVQGENLILTLTNRLEDPPVVTNHILNKLTVNE
jgi:hypothetical protein